MTAKKRLIAWISVAIVLCLAIGLDIARHPTEREWAGFSLVNAVEAANQPGMSVVGLIGSDDERLSAPVSRDTELTEAQVEDMVRSAVTMAGGFGQQLKADAEWVVIKVNIVEVRERGSGVITDWRVVKGLIKVIHEAAPNARVTIAEGPAEWSPPDSPPVQGRAEIVDGFEIAGYRQLLSDPELKSVNLDIVDVNFDDPTEVEIPGGGYSQDKWFMPASILKSDFVISVPVLKIHEDIGMTNAMKNFVGIAPGMIYGWSKMSGYPPRSGNPGIPHTSGIIDETICDLVTAAGVDFALVDAIMCMEKAKTDKWNGNPIRMNTVIASADVVAADAVAAWLIGFNPFDIEYLTLAAQRGLGQCDPAKIQVEGSSLEELAIRFEKVSPQGRGGEMGHYGQGCRTWLLKGPFERQQQQAGEEFVDVKNPQALPGQNGWSKALYFHDDKIDLDKYYDDPFDCAVYAYAEFDALQAQEAELWAGSDEGMKVWINGEMVYEHAGRRRHRLPNDRPLVRIRAGKNNVLVRADQSRSRYDFSLNICEVEKDPRYDGNRVWSLQFNLPTGSTPASSQVEELTFSDGAIPADARMLEGIRVGRYQDGLVSALEGCMRFLGEELPIATLRGLTGHAFRFCVADSLGESAATRYSLSSMADLYANLGYRVRVISALGETPDFADKQQEAWDAICASIDRRVPVVTQAGRNYLLVNGYHVKKEQYYMIGDRGRQEQISIDQLGTDDRGGIPNLNVLLLEERQPVDSRIAELRALRFAVSEARRKEEPGNPLHCGFSGYEYWIEATEEGKVYAPDRLGRFIARVIESREAAGEYLRQIASHYPEAAAGRLLEAGDAYDREVKSLTELGQFFPERGRPKVDMKDPQARKEAGKLVREVYSREKKAVENLEKALAVISTTSSGDGSFTLTSPEVADGGSLPRDYTGDGSSATLPLQWTGAPGETQSFALIMHHIAPDRTKWYWILYNIPATTARLPRNVDDVGMLGNNSVNGRCEYAPPHSKGPGEKTYIYTLYALSSPIEPDVEPAGVSRDVLLAAMRDKVLASAQLRVVYSRNPERRNIEQ